jgi:hypothetical protein
VGFTGTRLPVATVIENLEDLSIDEVIEQFDVTRVGVAPRQLGLWSSSVRCSPTGNGTLRLRPRWTPKHGLRIISGGDDLRADTHPTERKFSVWVFYDPTRGPRHVETRNTKLVYLPLLRRCVLKRDSQVDVSPVAAFHQM